MQGKNTKAIKNIDNATKYQKDNSANPGYGPGYGCGGRSFGMMGGYGGRGMMRGFYNSGTGKSLQFYPPDCQVTGIDFSPGMLDKARKQVEGRPGILILA